MGVDVSLREKKRRVIDSVERGNVPGMLFGIGTKDVVRSRRIIEGNKMRGENGSGVITCTSFVISVCRRDAVSSQGGDELSSTAFIDSLISET